MEPAEAPMKPSWQRWPPNCCEACVGPWRKVTDWSGTCEKSDSLYLGEVTDARYRCPAFVRKAGI